MFAINAAWLELALTAADLIAWTQTTLLDDELAKAEPKTLRHRAAARRRPHHLPEAVSGLVNLSLCGGTKRGTSSTIRRRAVTASPIAPALS